MLRGPDTSERVFRGSLPLQLFYKMRCVLGLDSQAGNWATLKDAVMEVLRALKAYPLRVTDRTADPHGIGHLHVNVHICFSR